MCRLEKSRIDGRYHLKPKGNSMIARCIQPALVILALGLPLTGQELPAPALQGALGLELLPAQHADGASAAREYMLAELQYKNGLRIVFSYDEDSKDYGLLQTGRIGESTPLARDRFDTLLDAYLAFTPVN